MPNKAGRWVTINGRAVFIGEGQSLEEALNTKGQVKKSGSSVSSAASSGGATRERVASPVGFNQEERNEQVKQVQKFAKTALLTRLFEDRETVDTLNSMPKREFDKLYNELSRYDQTAWLHDDPYDHTRFLVSEKVIKILNANKKKNR